MAERAIAEAWLVKAYRRDRRIPESQVSHVLFTMALRLPDGGFNAVPPLPLDPEAPQGDEIASEGEGRRCPHEPMCPTIHDCIERTLAEARAEREKKSDG
jgi:hypothetical protein